MASELPVHLLQPGPLVGPKCRDWIQPAVRRRPTFGADGSLAVVEVRNWVRTELGALAMTLDIMSDASLAYATLSHRWSDGPTIKLSVDNLERSTTPQPVSELPATFRDAIAVALDLGIRYIWIDCLCIVQDSPQEQDWKEQGMEMCNIYTNAVVNISATGVPNNTHSFLKAYEGSAVPLPPTIQHRWKSRDTEQRQTKDTRSSGSTLPDIDDTDKWCIVDPYFWWSEVTNTVLLSRGWVFQERYLAPRVLHFGTNQLLWECTTMDACEVYPRGLPDYVKSGGHTDLKRLKLDDTVISSKAPQLSIGPDDPSPDPHLPPDASLQVWCDLVQAYTRTSLTKRKDKLIAFSGVAELVQKLYLESAENPKLKDEYASGIFERHLLLMLEWYTKRASWVPKTRPREYRAPTWSWASIDGRVFFDFLPHIIANPSGLPWPPLWATVLRDPRYPSTLPAVGVRNQYASWVPLVSDLAVGDATNARASEKRCWIRLRGHISSMQHIVNSAGQTPQRQLPGNQRPQPFIVTEDIRGEIFPKTSKTREVPVSRRGFHDRPCLPLRCLELIGADSQLKHWVTGLVLKPHKELESVYSRCGFFCFLSTEGVQRFGVRISGSSPFRAEFAKGMDISTIEIV
ncbi:uncharacterized protein PG986_003735 [Apiospora aurea]|uniref:Heterokaryon incompatibility domain-containing protein n=1 Tax=Apiospora aurea TaxID=335848 RepID=A0ABR1QSH8_9PEZI